MKIFFQANSDASEELKLKYQKIINILIKNGVNYYSNLQPERFEKADIFIFNQIDAVIIEGTRINSEASYILALALSQKKPIMFLVNRGTILEEGIRKLSDDKKLANIFYFHFYNDNNLEKTLANFIDLIGAGDARREIANIKFTLRMTPRIERYLAWKVTNTKIKKADYLRVLLSQLIENDEEYKKYLKAGKE